LGWGWIFAKFYPASFCLQKFEMKICGVLTELQGPSRSGSRVTKAGASWRGVPAGGSTIAATRTPELSAGMDFWPRLETRIHFLNLFADLRKFERKLQPLCKFFGRFYDIFS
jgi:hypothetical protein